MSLPLDLPSEEMRLVERLNEYNDAYRRGVPQVSDAQYDLLLARLRELAPEHPFLHRVEPETFSGKREIRHPVPMLSTDKAYTPEELERFVARVEKEAAEIGVSEVRFRVTPKLDGLAGRDDGTVFVTRGNGESGYEVSSAFAKGMIPLGGRGKGVGEMVILQSYFQEHLSDAFEHPRNLVVGIVSSDTVNEFARKALDDEAVHFVPYSELPSWEGSAAELLERMDALTDELSGQVDYPLDGMVAEVVNADVRSSMGATSHHYRWQIAIKRKGETALTEVREVVWQVGRTGKVTPVLMVEPVNVSGATIRRVTAHNAGLMEKKGLGPGAQIEIIRSGEVIPKVEAVLVPAPTTLPEICPSCGTALVRENDFLICGNEHCPDQVVQTIEHWFKTLGNADWFGRKTVEKLVRSGYDSLEKVYELGEEEFRAMGFGPVQSSNLAEAVYLSRTREVEDWRFLAALGIEDLGKGDSRKLLGQFRLQDLPEVTRDQIEAIHGFGAITASSIAAGLQRVAPTLRHLLDLGFKIMATGAAREQVADSALAGRHVVFTGKMRGSREDMQEEARAQGALVQSAVNSKTDFLICGENVGASKLAKARQFGTAILQEDEYLRLIGAEGQSNTRSLV
ncbi:MAG: DNA ligase [Deltaproteobacteria bacterium HGW-Deltaproteobacteria-18]|nr:MAG: DNA ligase [Deltaproteobacteria bacterium HGW-Deltaproteobacteria-18]